jgi:hypothetical protein
MYIFNGDACLNGYCPDEAIKPIRSTSVNCRIRDHLNSVVSPIAESQSDLTEAILDGRQPPRLMVKHIRTNDIPLEWNAQRRLFARFNE